MSKNKLKFMFWRLVFKEPGARRSVYPRVKNSLWGYFRPSLWGYPKIKKLFLIYHFTNNSSTFLLWPVARYTLGGWLWVTCLDLKSFRHLVLVLYLNCFCFFQNFELSILKKNDRKIYFFSNKTPQTFDYFYIKVKVKNNKLLKTNKIKYSI